MKKTLLLCLCLCWSLSVANAIVNVEDDNDKSAIDQNKTDESVSDRVSDDTRHPRSIFSLFFDGFKNIHDKLHDDHDEQKVKDAENDEASSAEKDQQQGIQKWIEKSQPADRNFDKDIILKSDCETKFVTVESVQYTEVKLYYSSKHF